MKKSIKFTLMAIGLFLLTMAYFSPLAYAVDGASQTSYNGHLCQFSGSTKQVCANCHIPHGAKGKKIWARNEIQGESSVSVKDLCASCHYTPNSYFPNIQSGLKTDKNQWCGDGESRNNNKIGNVFLDAAVDHVMNVAGVSVNIHSTKAEVPADFPVETEEGGEGFYCGSCHNPHKQPNGKTDGHGDYLRALPSVDVGKTHNRNVFCRQCHPRNEETVHVHSDPGSAEDRVCETCHRPHDAREFPNDANFERLIFVLDIPTDTPSGPPVFPVPSPGTVTQKSRGSRLISGGIHYESADCAKCHIYAVNDPTIPLLKTDHGNHPFGRPWSDTSCAVSGCHPSAFPGNKAFYLDGFNADGSASTQQIFGCITCHAPHTTEPGVEDNPAFLRYANFKADDTAYCEYCHNSGAANSKHPKSKSLLEANGGKHYKDTQNSPLERKYYKRGEQGTIVAEPRKCGGCMLCHFIHCDENDPRDVTAIDPYRADMDALMRVPAVSLNWGAQEYSGKVTGYNYNSGRATADRYEDMCFGCHGNSSIVNGHGTSGSLLKPAGLDYWSHRFACLPASTNTKANITGASGKFPLADGSGRTGHVSADASMDDYGTEGGRIYCGTCHDVHINSQSPYLYRITDRYLASPYVADVLSTTNQIEGFCEQCHCTVNNPDPMNNGTTHPVGDSIGPNPPNTCDPFPSRFRDGGSGKPNGIITSNSGVLCLSCHNVHAAATSWDGIVTGESTGSTKGRHGQLLVQDNFSDLPASGPGSNMCRDCHDQF